MLSESNIDKNSRLLKLATYASVGVASTLIVIKLVAWLLSDSISLLATLLDSCLDVAASLINLFAVRHALQPADKEHRFGHGKMESLAGLAQAAFIAGSALFLILQASGRILHPQPIAATTLGIVIMVVSIALTLGLLAIQNHVIKKTGSVAIKADSLHYKTDLMVNGGVIVALLFASYGWLGVDSLIAVAIGLLILYSAWHIADEAVQLLMDRELPDEQRVRITAIVCSHPRVSGMHDLRTRRSGMFTFIQLHLELDDELRLIEAHEISDQVEQQIMVEFPGAEVIIHEDPNSVIEHRLELK